MRVLKLLLLGTLLAATTAAGAPVGPVATLVVSCVPSAVPPPTTTCFNEVVGQPFTFWVLAVDSSFNVVPGYTGTVHITTSDPTATLPADHTFTASDAGIAPFVLTFNSVTSEAVPSFEAVYATDAANGLSSLNSGFFVFLPVRLQAAPALGAASLLLLGVLLIGLTLAFMGADGACKYRACKL